MTENFFKKKICKLVLLFIISILINITVYYSPEKKQTVFV